MNDHVEKLAGELRAMAAGVDTARARVTATDNMAQAVAARATRSGFTGIAHGTAEVRQAIGEIQARLTTINTAITEAAMPVAAASTAASPQQTLAVLSAAAQQISAVHDEVSATIDKVRETQQVAGAVLRGGRPGPMLSMLDSIKQALAAVAHRGGSARQHVAAAVGEAEQLGDPSRAGGDGDTSPLSVPARQPPEQRWPGYPARQSLSWSDRRHIVYGDEDDLTSGGHLHGLNRPNKTEFPPDWDEDKIAQETASVAQDPERVATLPDGTWRAVGVRDGVTINVFVRPDGRIAAGHPVNGAGVRKNPPNGGT